MMHVQGTVLVVDDEEPVRTLLRRALEKDGYHVLTAADGQEALDWVSRQSIDVVLLDIKMPGMSGVEVLRRLSVQHPDICVVVVTALIETQTAVDAMKLGAYDYITKPFDLDDMVLKVANAKARRNLVVQNQSHQKRLEQTVSEQAERLQEQFAELVNTLAREHKLLYSLQTQSGSKGGKPPLSSLPSELQNPMNSAEEFREALLRVLKNGKLELD